MRFVVPVDKYSYLIDHDFEEKVKQFLEEPDQTFKNIEKVRILCF